MFIIALLSACVWLIIACIATLNVYDLPPKKRTFDHYLALFAWWFIALAHWLGLILWAISTH